MPCASVCKLSPEPGAAEADVAESWNCRMSVAYTYMSKEHTGRRKKNAFFFSVIPESPIDES